MSYDTDIVTILFDLSTQLLTLLKLFTVISNDNVAHFVASVIITKFISLCLRKRGPF